tara:strand:- start:1042 stop:1380 length:339 start_codon:yes stop_codon:yes gene_type:complete
MFNFGRKTKKVPKEGEDYKFIDFTNSDITGIMVLKGEYSGVVYHYGKVRVKEQGEFATLEFGFTLVNSGKHDIDLLQKDEEFVTIMGDILSEILTKSDNEPIRKDDSEEFDL